VALAYLTELIHRRPRAWVPDIERLHQLLEQHVDERLRAAFERGLSDCYVLYSQRAVIASPRRDFDAVEKYLDPSVILTTGNGTHASKGSVQPALVRAARAAVVAELVRHGLGQAGIGERRRPTRTKTDGSQPTGRSEERVN
jgi:hypothetical protein